MREPTTAQLKLETRGSISLEAQNELARDVHCHSATSSQSWTREGTQRLVGMKLSKPHKPTRRCLCIVCARTCVRVCKRVGVRFCVRECVRACAASTQCTNQRIVLYFLLTTAEKKQRRQRPQTQPNLNATL
jgi:hypothetical protein